MANTKHQRSYSHVRNSRLCQKAIGIDRREHRSPSQKAEGWLTKLIARLFNRTPVL